MDLYLMVIRFACLTQEDEVTGQSFQVFTH